MISLQGTTPPEKVAETGLMERLGKSAIRRPTVVPEAAREVHL
jgi:hypothetical protein